MTLFAATLVRGQAAQSVTLLATAIALVDDNAAVSATHALCGSDACLLLSSSAKVVGALLLAGSAIGRRIR